MIRKEVDTTDSLFRPSAGNAREARSYTVAGLFAGIGGLELGLQRAGHEAQLLCELDPWASRVLRKRFPQVDSIVGDVRELDALPGVGLVTAGFPCQDLSQAGRTAGIGGARSGLVDEVFRLLADSSAAWVLLENVPFMLSLDRGGAMGHLVGRFEELGYRWAYRVVDTRAFGVPQRRRRVLFLASRLEDPRDVLLSEDSAGPRKESSDNRSAFGFYWTEGTRGLGWAVDSVPTLKGGSTIGIPSPPAIWMPDGAIVTPHVEDAERLQGFPKGWTRPCMRVDGAREGTRWKLVGNAVSVPVARWVGEKLSSPTPYDDSLDRPVQGPPWPTAAWGGNGSAYQSLVSEWPLRKRRRRLVDFLTMPTKPLSARAARGFLKRAESGRLRFAPGFLDAVRHHVDHMTSDEGSERAARGV